MRSDLALDNTVRFRICWLMALVDSMLMDWVDGVSFFEPVDGP